MCIDRCYLGSFSPFEFWTASRLFDFFTF
uniref:Uncharacterized protein n=1 Tax=Arundo donax TaxID=35708 RepID=A0A0A9GJ92_ARUDO